MEKIRGFEVAKGFEVKKLICQKEKQNIQQDTILKLQKM